MQPSLYCSLNKLPPPQVCQIKVMFELNAEENDVGTGFKRGSPVTKQVEECVHKAIAKHARIVWLDKNNDGD